MAFTVLMLLPFCPEQFCRPGLGTGACSLPRGQGHDDTTWQWESFPVIPSHSVTQAYPLQKTAYRRANGGSGAPGVHEDVAPKFVSAEVANWQVCLRVQKGLGPKENDESMLYWHQDGIKFHDQKES